MANLWAQFQRLIPQEPLLVGTVLTLNTDGTSTVQTPEGGVLRVRGQGVGVGLQAFVRGGRVEGAAPSLTTFTLDV